MEGSNNLKLISYSNLFDEDFSINDYQREYVWESEDLDDLLLSINDGIFYGVGTFTFNRKFIEIIDGQQRITSLAMMAGYINNDKEAKIEFNLSKSVEKDINKIINWDLRKELKLSNKPSFYTLQLKNIKTEVIKRTKDVKYINRNIKKIIKINKLSLISANHIILEKFFSANYKSDVIKFIERYKDNLEAKLILDRIKVIENIYSGIQKIKEIKLPLFFVPKSNINKTFVAMNSKGKDLDPSIYFKQLILSCTNNEKDVAIMWSKILNEYYEIKVYSENIKLKGLIMQAHNSLCNPDTYLEDSFGKSIKTYKKYYKKPINWSYGDEHLDKVVTNIEWANTNLIIKVDENISKEIITSEWIPSVYRVNHSYFSMFIPLIYKIQRFQFKGKMTGVKKPYSDDKINVLKLHLGLITMMSSYVPKNLMPSNKINKFVDKYLKLGDSWITKNESSKHNINNFIQDSFNMFSLLDLKSLTDNKKVSVRDFKLENQKNDVDGPWLTSKGVTMIYLAIFYTLEKYPDRKLDYDTYQNIIKNTFRSKKEMSIEHIFNREYSCRISDCIILESGINEKLDSLNIGAKMKELENYNDTEFGDLYKQRFDDIDLENIEDINKVIIKYRNNFDLMIRNNVVSIIESNRKKEEK